VGWNAWTAIRNAAVTGGREDGTMCNRESNGLPRKGIKPVRMRGFAAGVLVLMLLGLAGCGHVQTLSTPNVVTVQEFGCAGDLPSPYAPYCRPVRP